MRVLILVCTSHEHPYDLFLKAQRETWDSIHHPMVDTVFYRGSGNNTWEGNMFISDCPHGYYTQQWKHKQAIDQVWEEPWDIIFRTHSSSYVDKAKLYELCKTLPQEKLYGGWNLGVELPKIEWQGKTIRQSCVSGAGIFYSRDIADILRKNIPPGEQIEEDVLSGRILQTFGIHPNFDSKDRVDLKSIKDYRPSYHYRIKSNDRLRDIQTMHELHEKIIKEK